MPYESMMSVFIKWTIVNVSKNQISYQSTDGRFDFDQDYNKTASVKYVR